jgi:Ca-activated chloride channel homolog
LSGGNSGTSEYVKPDEDIEAHVGRFYAKMTSPVLADLHVELAGIDVNRTYPGDLPDLFEGGQIVWVGRYRQSGRTTLRITGKVGGERRSFEFPAELEVSDRGSAHEFVERIWATRRVGYLIDQIDMSGQNRELIDELVSLSTRYGILTPYTAFLADERVPLHAAMQNARQAGENLVALRSVSGGFGVAQREAKQFYMRAEKASGAPGGLLMDQQGETQNVQAKLRQVGSKTFYFKENRWIDSTVKPDEDAKAKLIRQFSNDFFNLARSQSADLNQYLTFTEPVTIKLAGTVYRFDPAEGTP